MADTSSGGPVHPNPDYQDRDILIKPIIWFAVGLTVLTLVVVAGLGLFFQVMELRMQAAESTIPAAARERQLPPGKRLVVDERLELVQYLENARTLMESVALVDADRGIARIPVSVAMERVAANGLPRWALPAPAPAAETIKE
jgi:hypothetical protein